MSNALRTSASQSPSPLGGSGERYKRPNKRRSIPTWQAKMISTILMLVVQSAQLYFLGFPQEENWPQVECRVRP